MMIGLENAAASDQGPTPVPGVFESTIVRDRKHFAVLTGEVGTTPARVPRRSDSCIVFWSRRNFRNYRRLRSPRRVPTCGWALEV
jgi:hypothetical protein